MFVLNGNPGKVLKVLGSCGLTEYESKAYFTLLLTDREKMWELSKKSSVPQSKIYLVMDSLKYKGLVDLSAECPKTSSPRPFEPYLSRAINSKQKGISEIIENGNELRDIVYVLKPIAVRYKRYKVFEPKYKRRR